MGERHHQAVTPRDPSTPPLLRFDGFGFFGVLAVSADGDRTCPDMSAFAESRVSAGHIEYNVLIVRQSKIDDRWGDLAADTRPQRILSSSWTQLSVPWLTILFHDDHRRVGEVAVLTALVSGERVKISRLEPHFGGPGRSRQPLADPHLSRTPLSLALKNNGIELDCGDTSTPVSLGNEPVSDHRLLAMDGDRTPARCLG